MGRGRSLQAPLDMCFLYSSVCFLFLSFNPEMVVGRSCISHSLFVCCLFKICINSIFLASDFSLHFAYVAWFCRACS